MRRWFKWRTLPAEFFKIPNAKDGWIKVLKQSHFSLEIVTRLSIKPICARSGASKFAACANVRKSTKHSQVLQTFFGRRANMRKVSGE